jgi:23S rRNA pseudouridine1911/1915/1917 synthase
MIVDADLFPSLSKARKACRQGKILWVDSEQATTHQKALVGDRMNPLDKQKMLARQETAQVLERQSTLLSTTTTRRTTPRSQYDICSLVAPSFRLSIIYEDDFLAIVNKPPGVLVHPEAGKHRNPNTVLFALPYALQRPQPTSDFIAQINDTILDLPVPVHRLDFATSGILVVAKTTHASRFLAQQFEHRYASKTYVALVYGIPKADDGWGSSEEDQRAHDPPWLRRLSKPHNHSKMPPGEWNLADCFLDDKRATTWWRIKESFGFCVETKTNDPSSATQRLDLKLSVVELKPTTGRYHQLRRQMAHQLGTPMVGDPIYSKDYVDEVLSSAAILDRYHRGLMLCSNELVIAHPFYNTPEGKEVWKTMPDRRIIPSSQSVHGQSIVYEEDGIVLIKTNIELPKKFLKFLKAMEKMTSYASSLEL